MNVLSLFDGMSCGRIALGRAGIKVDNYFASEIDPYAEKISESNYPDIIRLGDITKWREWDIPTPDIILAGSPCQGFSFAGKGLNFNDPRSALFFVFADILRYYKPKYFLLENVKMKAEHQDVISGILGEIYPECVNQAEMFRTGRLEPVLINSALVSAQNRERLYWCNWKVSQPEDKGILLRDIIETGQTDREKSYCVDANYAKGGNEKSYLEHGRRQLIMKDTGKRIIGVQNDAKHSTASEHVYHRDNDKSNALITAHVPKLIITGGAFRGRNPENPTSREAGLDTVQMLEMRGDEKTNTLTTVQKDNVCVMIGQADINGNDSIKRVYSPDGKSPCLTAIQGGNQEPKVYIPGFENKTSQKMQKRVINNMKNPDEKGNCLLASNYKGAQSNGSTVILDSVQWRKLTVTECERLQTVPDGYCRSVSNSRAYHALGNGWTVDVISHILKQMEIQK